ncbi:hypothetical protein ACIRL3_09840 [Streptomyces sp. NPDC102384]|uniref:hypothetical protein n=2 Tax=Streptomyces TaxID=1883 RepID=UPI003804E443
MSSVAVYHEVTQWIAPLTGEGRKRTEGIMAKKLHIKTLKCVEQEDLTLDDRIVVYVNGDPVNGAAFDDGQSRYLDTVVSFSSEAVVKLVEVDDVDADDVLGVHTVRSGSGVLEFTRDDAHYQMSYAISGD